MKAASYIGGDMMKVNHYIMKTRLDEMRKLCKDQADLIELLQAQLKQKERTNERL